MTLAEWVREYTIADASISAIIGVNMFAENGRYEDIPMAVFARLQGSFIKNRLLQSEVISIKGYDTTRGDAETLGRHIYNRYDTSVTRISAVDSNLTINSVEIINHIDALYDEANKVWFSVTDIKINYYRS